MVKVDAVTLRQQNSRAGKEVEESMVSSIRERHYGSLKEKIHQLATDCLEGAREYQSSFSEITDDLVIRDARRRLLSMINRSSLLGIEYVRLEEDVPTAVVLSIKELRGPGIPAFIDYLPVEPITFEDLLDKGLLPSEEEDIYKYLSEHQGLYIQDTPRMESGGSIRSDHKVMVYLDINGPEDPLYPYCLNLPVVDSTEGVIENLQPEI